LCVDRCFNSVRSQLSSVALKWNQFIRRNRAAHSSGGYIALFYFDKTGLNLIYIWKINDLIVCLRQLQIHLRATRQLPHLTNCAGRENLSPISVNQSYG